MDPVLLIRHVVEIGVIDVVRARLSALRRLLTRVAGGLLRGLVHLFGDGVDLLLEFLLLGLDAILVYYPGHLAMAVGFDEPVEGDYIMLDGRRFVVCDPTYLGADVGETMRGMDNRSADVILLEKSI